MSHVDAIVNELIEIAQSLADSQAQSGAKFFNNTAYDTRQGAGFVKHGFILSHYFLMIRSLEGSLHAQMALEDFFNYTMEQTVRIGGDTDTNACIVGGVIGAYVQV